MLRIQNYLGVVEENDLDDLVAQSEDDGVLCSHPLLHVYLTCIRICEESVVLLFKLVQITSEILHQLDLLVKLLRLGVIFG